MVSRINEGDPMGLRGCRLQSLVGVVLLANLMLMCDPLHAEECANTITYNGHRVGIELEAAPDFHEQWAMAEGTVCTNIFRSAPIFDFQIDRKPKHGQAGTSNSAGSRGFAYRPDPGFTGMDEFVVSFVVRNETEHRNTTKKITISVTVR
jgi:hypothetical protein